MVNEPRISPTQHRRALNILLENEEWDKVDTECRLVHPEAFEKDPDRIRALLLSRTFIPGGISVHEEMREAMRIDP